MENLGTTISTSRKAALIGEITRINGPPGRRPANGRGLCVARELAGQLQSSAEQLDLRSLEADMTVELAMRDVANALELGSPEDLSAPAGEAA